MKSYIKRIIFFLVLSLLFYGCGFESIYSLKNTNFRFSEIITNDENISLNIKDRLTSYYSTDLGKTDYSLEIKLNKKRIVKSKNKLGEALVYSIEIKGDILIFKNQSLQSTLDVNEFFEYQNTDDKFELSTYERNIEKNLISNIANDLIIRIIDIQND
tara:strand:- start:22 stop:495 length:474 start_codon:yes stop_codon:yes gene_type:complete